MRADDPEITLDVFLSVCGSGCQDLKWVLTVSFILVHFLVLELCHSLIERLKENLLTFCHLLQAIFPTF